MVIVPEQVEIVKQIFADTLTGKSTHAISKELNERGIPTNKGGRWALGTINGIISNEKYTGDVIYQKTYTDSSFNRHTNYGELDQYLVWDHHAAIISHEEFDRANAVLKQRGREKGNGGDSSRYQKRYSFSEDRNSGGLSRTDRGAFDVLPVPSCHVECVILMSRAEK